MHLQVAHRRHVNSLQSHAFVHPAEKPHTTGRQHAMLQLAHDHQGSLLSNTSVTALHSPSMASMQAQLTGSDMTQSYLPCCQCMMRTFLVMQ